MNYEILKQLVGCTIEEKDGAIVITPKQEEEKQEQSKGWEPKDGDILAYQGKAFIFTGKYSEKGNPCAYCGVDKSGDFYGYHFWSKLPYDLATDEEKNELFEAMKRAGKQWNAEKKRIEDYRWRAKRDGKFYYVTDCGDIEHGVDTHNSIESFCDCYFESGNYFPTEEAAKESALYKAYIR